MFNFVIEPVGLIDPVNMDQSSAQRCGAALGLDEELYAAVDDLEN